MIGILYVGIGGFIGAAFRYIFTLIGHSSGNFPLNTLLII